MMYTFFCIFFAPFLLISNYPTLIITLDMRKIGYVDGKNDAVELAAVTASGDEVVSGDLNELNTLIMNSRQGDTIVIFKLSRLGGNIVTMFNSVRQLMERGITLISITENIDTSTPEGKLRIEFLGQLAEQSTEKFVTDVTKGRQAAKEKGVQFGPKKGLYKHNAIAPKLYEMYLSRQYTTEELRLHFGIGSRSTVYKIIHMLQEKAQKEPTSERVEEIKVSE